MVTHIRLETLIAAPPEVCFDLSRDLDLHTRSMAHTRERAVGGLTSGLIGLDEEVTWEGRHFGVRQRFTSRITAFDRPRHFRDVMVKGAFAAFIHDHRFESEADGTRMIDEVSFAAPGGPFGRIVERLVLRGYLRRLLAARNAVIKAAAESADGLRP